MKEENVETKAFKGVGNDGRAHESVESRDLLLIDLARRMQDLQSAVQRQAGPKELPWSAHMLELAKTALTGWPTFAILFLLIRQREV